MTRVQASPSFAVRLRAHLGVKIALAAALNIWALVPYFWLQRNVFFPVTMMPQSALDVRLGFEPRAVWAYLSLFLLMPLAPMQMGSTQQLRRYALGIVAMGAVANLIFFFWPTAVARGDAGGEALIYRALVAVDMPLNAFPSLHAAVAVYSALCCEQLPASRAWRAVVWPWVLVIVWAMLSIKQHVVLDAAGGALLGWASYGWAFRNLPYGKKAFGTEAKTIKGEGWIV